MPSVSTRRCNVASCARLSSIATTDATLASTVCIRTRRHERTCGARVCGTGPSLRPSAGERHINTRPARAFAERGQQAADIADVLNSILMLWNYIQSGNSVLCSSQVSVPRVQFCSRRRLALLHQCRPRLCQFELERIPPCQ
mmetsp:Transcript_24804/g.57350  ORF Transcript_24804/g.57350 Transcript_24804/m.57350 type:complete len:142 (+) Transcript_24804:1015-1440(+)